MKTDIIDQFLKFLIKFSIMFLIVNYLKLEDNRFFLIIMSIAWFGKTYFVLVKSTIFVKLGFQKLI